MTHDENFLKTSDSIQYELSKANAKRMRREPTDAERVLWNALRGNAIGEHFRRQHPIGIYIADFICLKKKLVIEIDGEYHNDEAQQKWDGLRSEYLVSRGFDVLRFTNREVICELDETIEKIKQFCGNG